ncbi:unnamed protein product, partial [Laminaria digitata]
KQQEGEEQENTKEETVERGPETACTIDMSKLRWPEGLKNLFLVHFNRPVDGAFGPDCLQVLAFHIPSRLAYVDGTMGIFNWPLDGVTFPADLRELFLGNSFNQPIAGVAWPEGLERLSMPGFNRPIHD